MMDDLAAKIAKRLCEDWTIGTSSQFCDESDFDYASEEDVAEVIREVLAESAATPA
jgi:hypothetical protein